MSITIFTDGSSRGNPGPGGWGAIIRTDDEVIELGAGEKMTTNNKMELSAAINALAYVDENDLEGKIVLQSDSKYVIQGITEWVKGWQRNGWKTAAKKDVGNRELWEALHLVAEGLDIEWRYVQGHAGHPGNERCDEIATAMADGIDPELFKGARKFYTVDLDAEPAVKTAKKKSSLAKAYSYVSLVDGVVLTHKTWAECEARVKGVRGAKYKKATTPAEEAALIAEYSL